MFLVHLLKKKVILQFSSTCWRQISIW